MKIYNEIVIDMNPESSSYGETLHEDSYEYEGDMMLMQTQVTLDKGKRLYYSNKESGNRIDQSTYWRLRSETAMTNPARKGHGRESYRISYEYPIWEQTEGGTWTNTGEYGTKMSSHYDNLGSAPKGQFTYDAAGEFDPTSDEFRKSIEQTGGFGEVAAGYGQDAGDFDELYDAPLEQAERQYGTGMESLALQTGKSLYDINRQTEEAQVTSGFESMGSIDYTSKRAEKGVMGDYLLQQRVLSNQLAAQTEDFWKTTEDQFYAELDENIAAS